MRRSITIWQNRPIVLLYVWLLLTICPSVAKINQIRIWFVSSFGVVFPVSQKLFTCLYRKLLDAFPVIRYVLLHNFPFFEEKSSSLERINSKLFAKTRWMDSWQMSNSPAIFLKLASEIGRKHNIWDKLLVQ